ncbi:MAG: DNA-3-methyladenine glycosylase I [Sphingobacteriales bacterium]|jgi:DNA-3-methyladenine glycosylase I|nr:DNA-3-methyladenine glycosylase I [Sphingobacteriales bacterium]
MGKKEIIRCNWCVGKPLYEQYHDEEWGVPVYDDQKQFEFLVLESAQAGLSWWTILQRRDGYRKAFSNFDYRKVAKFTPDKVEKLLQDSGIIRNRAKIEATVNNAQRFMEVQKEFGSFSKYIWSFVGGKPMVSQLKQLKEIQPTSPESDALAKDMKRRGFKFLGSTTLYAHMQATGLVNDHLMDCHRYKKCR